jgi:hypothetical protein
MWVTKFDVHMQSPRTHKVHERQRSVADGGTDGWISKIVGLSPNDGQVLENATQEFAVVCRNGI